MTWLVGFWRSTVGAKVVMAVTGLLQENPKPSDEQIIHGLEGNLCRCTGYVNIIKAVKQASAAMQG